MVEVAVLETARGGIVRRGLGYDWSDVGVITNIQPDHFGQDGIDSLDDILHIKSLVAERVRIGGTVVLNADDPLLASLPSHRRMQDVRRQIVYFGMSAKSAVIQQHVAAGNTAFFLHDGWIVEASGFAEHWVARAADLPVTMGGLAHFQIQNALAAVAACRAQGVSAKAIATSLKVFQSNQHNEGRCNLYRLGQAYVMLDYGHNAAAFDSMSRIAEQWPGDRVIGVVGVPGDRNDSLIEQAAKSATGVFDRIIIREDHDLRGRQPGEVASILAGTIREAGVDCTICPAVCDAMNLAFEDLQPNDLVIVFFEKLDEVAAHLAKNGAQLASDWPFLPGLVPDQVFRPDFAMVDAEDPT
jgi:cyanophycin synthetase